MENPIYLICSFREEKLNFVEQIFDKLKNSSEQKIPSILQNLDLFETLILNNHLNIIEFVLKEFGNYLIDREDNNGNQLVHLAAKNGSTELLKILFKHNAFSFKTNLNNDNALHIAAINNRFNFIKEFLIYENNLTKNSKTTNTLATEDESLINENKEDLYDQHIPCVQCFNKNNFTPLFLAIIGGHLKCVEAITSSEDVDYAAQDKDGNTIYHKCAELNNFESIRYLLTRKESKYLEPLYIKNNNMDHVVSTASNYGNLEVIRLVLSKINDGFTSPESYLLELNQFGQNCFHIACSKGFYNIVEYFLKDCKMKFFLNTHDDYSNTGLHLASSNGFLSIVKILIQNDIDINLRNKDNNTALDLSCKKGFFDISKILVSNFTTSIATYYKNQKEYPLHVAAQEGSYQVVEILLSKGYPIETKNEQNKNCLDVAIENERREVIKVLLKNENWTKILDISIVEPLDLTDNIKGSFFKGNINIIKASLLMRPKVRKESAQINE
jgi:ankyrin repeat protein